MHIAYPLGMGPVGTFLFYVEIFGYLTPDSHYDCFKVSLTILQNQREKINVNYLNKKHIK